MSPNPGGNMTHQRRVVVMHSRNRGAYATPDDVYSRYEIGQAVIDIQAALGLSDEALAAALNTTTDSLCRLKSGELKPRIINRLLKFCKGAA